MKLCQNDADLDVHRIAQFRHQLPQVEARIR